uniref:palmitoyltransferase ZDHHC5 isoform X2 n=1 Tax=Monopterus albus TaxID=43700 RepID=UPI0009B2EAFB|nr:palmitoyltransferase ZDHHC5-like isoform X2 [Monopterus albus]
MPASSADSLKPSAFIPVCTAASLLVGSTSLFFVFTCPWLAVTICPAVPPCCAILFLFVLANFTMATFMDAGVLPVAKGDEDKDDDFRAPLYKNVHVKGVQVRMKWCTSCHFYRPPRCSHCSVCDHCVEDFDHHCPWVNNCIGRRNYRYFFLFLLSLTFHMISVFTFGLIYILHYRDDLWKLHCTVTLVVISISGLFLIPVLGLTGFHLYLVSRGRTTNEQVTGKFQGGRNPFTRGCCDNLEYLVCSPISPKYTARPYKKTVIHVQPPFLRPVIDRQIPVKRTSTGAVEPSDIKQVKTPPPLPPKPDHGLLKHKLAAMNEMGHHTKSINPVSIPTVPQLRPVLEAISRGSSPIPPEQLLKMSEQQGNNKGPDLCSEFKESPVGGSEQGGLSVQPSLQTNSSLQLNSMTLNSRSLTLKQGIISSSIRVASHSSSKFSYDSIINTVDPQFLAQRGPPQASYRFMTLSTDGTVVQRPPPHTYNPVFRGANRQPPQPSLQGLTSRDPSSSFQGFSQRDHSPPFPRLMPRDLASQSITSQDLTPPVLARRDMTCQSVRDSLRDLGPQGLTPHMSAAACYDNFSKTMMASVHKRQEMEERDRMLHLQARSQMLYGPDVGIYDIPSRRSLPPDNIQPPACRGPTPPAYGSREFLMSTGIHGYGTRTSPLSSSSTLSLTRGPKTSSSPLQSSSSSLQGKDRPSSPTYHPSERQPQLLLSSTSTLPRIPSSSTSYTPPMPPIPLQSDPRSHSPLRGRTLGALK